jgi:hypothetical protein
MNAFVDTDRRPNVLAATHGFGLQPHTASGARLWIGLGPGAASASVTEEMTRSVPALAPHDLRRTCARLCHQAGGELEQIQFLLGHVSVQTTERYLGCKQRFRNAVNDRIGLEPNSPDTQERPACLPSPANLSVDGTVD